jgi:hypothetical protein
MAAHSGPKLPVSETITFFDIKSSRTLNHDIYIAIICYQNGMLISVLPLGMP